MLDSHLYRDYGDQRECPGCEHLGKFIDRHHEDFYMLMDMATGQLPFDKAQWEDSLSTLNKFFDVSYPLHLPKFARQSKIVETRFDEEFLQQAALI